MQVEAFDELDRVEEQHWWFKGMRYIAAQFLTGYRADHTGLLVLEAGCGAGGNMRALAPLGTVMGLDYSARALQSAGRDQAGRLCRASIEALPYADNTFDLITSFDVISSDMVTFDHRVFHEFARVLRPEGRVLIRTAGMKSLRGSHDYYVGHTRRYTTQDMRDMLVQAGLTPLRITYANSLLLPIVFPVRKLQLLRMKLTGAVPGTDIVPLPAPINALFLLVLRLEAWWIGCGRSFPAGVSVYGLATKRA